MLDLRQFAMDHLTLSPLMRGRKPRRLSERIGDRVEFTAVDVVSGNYGTYVIAHLKNDDDHFYKCGRVPSRLFVEMVEAHGLANVNEALEKEPLQCKVVTQQSRDGNMMVMLDFD